MVVLGKKIVKLVLLDVIFIQKNGDFIFKRLIDCDV